MAHSPSALMKNRHYGRHWRTMSVHVPIFQILRRIAGVSVTRLRDVLIGLAAIALTATAPFDRHGRLSATPSATPVALTAATGEIVAVGSRAFFYVPPGAE